jgi:cell division septal protein FtsQ
MQGMKWLTYRKFRFLVAFVLLCIVFGGIVYAIRNGFEVQEIEFSGEGMNIQFNERLITGNIIFFPTEKVRQELLKEYPQLKDVIIKKKFPHTITIIPVLRRPFALLVTSKASYGIDEEGNVVSIGLVDPLLPELRIDVPSARVGMAVEDPNVRRALDFLKRSSSVFHISGISTSDDGLSIRAISDKTEILFTQSQNIETLMATLQTIISGVRIKGTMPKIIDVRFTKPVIQW